MIIVPAEKVIKLNLSLADGLKHIVSVGAPAIEPATPLEIK